MHSHRAAVTFTPELAPDRVAPARSRVSLRRRTGQFAPAGPSPARPATLQAAPGLAPAEHVTLYWARRSNPCFRALFAARFKIGQLGHGTRRDTARHGNSGRVSRLLPECGRKPSTPETRAAEPGSGRPESNWRRPACEFPSSGLTECHLLSEFIHLRQQPGPRSLTIRHSF
jgi:hypothetical protein